MQQAIKRFLITAVGVLLIAAAGVGAFVYSGVYNIGADEQHSRPVYALLQTLRERSIAAHSRGVDVPDLRDAGLILKGAGQYAAMCTQCHLAPGMKDTEMRPGLYPQPPNLARLKVDPKAAFWVIKHGIKMSAMPAWGGSHDDATIWSMVAFVQKLPDLSPQQYKDIVARAPPDDDMDMGGADDHGSADGAARPTDSMPRDAMPGMAMPAEASSARAPAHPGG